MEGTTTQPFDSGIASFPDRPSDGTRSFLPTAVHSTSSTGIHKHSDPHFSTDLTDSPLTLTTDVHSTAGTSSPVYHNGIPPVTTINSPSYNCTVPPHLLSPHTSSPRCSTVEKHSACRSCLSCRCHFSEKREPFWWYWYDWAQNAYRLGTTFFIPTFISALWESGEGQEGGKGMEERSGVTAESFWNYLQVASTVAVCVSYLTFCSVSEFGNLKKRMLVVFAVTGACATMLMCAAGKPVLVFMVGALYIISRICERCATIFYDALLKPIAYSHKCNPNSLSAEGVAFGYAGLLGFAVTTCVVLVPSAFVESEQVVGGLKGWLDFRIPLLICGLWWLGFAQLTFFGVLNYTGKPYPYKVKGPCRFVFFAFTEGAKQQRWALQQLFHMRDLGFYTLSWLFLSDAFSTLETMIAVLASSLWHHDQYKILIGALIVYLSAPLGLMFYRFLVVRKFTTVYHVLVFNTITILLMSIGLLWGQYLGVLYAVVGVMGFQLGTLDAFGRSVAVTMIPLSTQAQFLSFINLSSKGTSWIAPLVIATVDGIYIGSALYVTIIAVVCEGAIGVLILILGVNHMRGVEESEIRERQRRESLGQLTMEALSTPDINGSGFLSGSSHRFEHWTPNCDDISRKLEEGCTISHLSCTVGYL
eukprot:GHVQ01013208.1.p1 GENE.GHVQ01013208.1~~GHVQ01013208.1.p1  ORF type:complete len:660 (-),score=78.64 GHVQ01013208.1:759-2690(-)